MNKNEYKGYEAVMGLEIHVQVVGCDCNSKAFSPTRATNDEERPNWNIDTLDFGLPGSLPRFNEKVAELATRTGLALNCEIQNLSLFDDKNYQYPDLPCGRQITQQYYPIAKGGQVPIPTEKSPDRYIALDHIHIEQDAGKSNHDALPDCSAIDYNRAGIGLLEIVTQPCIYDIADLNIFLKSLRAILIAIKVSNCNMDKGEMRADLSLSVRKIGVKTLGTRVEIKNLNSINGVQKAAKHEFVRQVEAILAGEKILQETRGFDPKSQTTFAMRLKEDANEYLYIPDYNLPPLELTDEYIQHQKNSLPKLPKERCAELVGKKLPWSNAYLIAYEQEYFEYFTQLTKGMTRTQTNTAAKLMIGDLFGLLKDSTRDLQSFNQKYLKELTLALDTGKISSKIAKELLLLAFEKDISPNSQIVPQVSDVNAIAKCVDQVLLNSPNEVARYKDGKTNLLGLFVGTVMKEMKNANPNIVSQIVQDKLKD